MSRGSDDERARVSGPRATPGSLSAGALLDALDEPAAIAREDGSVVAANAAFRGRFPPGPLGLAPSIGAVAGPYAEEAEGRELVAIVRDGSGSIDLTAFSADGDAFPCTAIVRTIGGGDEDDGGAPRLVVLRDSAARQRLEAELRMKAAVASRERELQRAVAATFDEPVLVLDDTERLLLANGAACRLLALVESECTGRSLAELPIPAAIRGSWLAFLASPRLEDSVTARIPSSEGDLSLRLVMRRPRDRSGSPIGSVLVARDPRDDEQAAADRQLSVSALGHELRTPLVAIQGFAETLAGEDDLDPALRREFSGIVLREAERLGRLVENLLQVTRLAGGSALLDRRVLDLHALVRRAVESIIRDESLDAGFVRLSPPTRRATAFVDEPLLRESLRQLLRNAATHAAVGGGVDVSVVPGDREHEILVRDYGPGLPAERLERVFEPFAGAGAPRRAGAGAGLGLHLGRRVATAHGGSLHAESPPGGGLLVALRLPAH